MYIYIYIYIDVSFSKQVAHPLQGEEDVWEGYLELQVSCCKRATNYRALLQKMMCKDKAPESYAISPISARNFKWVQQTRLELF